MVFQAHVEVDIPPHSANHSQYSLWLLFESVGVAAISPGQCEITMNPLGSGEVMTVSPVMSATSETSEGTLEGNGFWDKVDRYMGIISTASNNDRVRSLLNTLPGGKRILEGMDKVSSIQPLLKKAKTGGAVTGGAVIGKGLNDWV